MAKRKARTIVVFARKGGVGKTTVATAVAALLAAKHETLLVDLDNQGSAAISLGCDLSTGTADLLDGVEIEAQRIKGLKLDVAAGNSRLLNMPLDGLDAIRELPYRYFVFDCGSATHAPDVLRAVKPDLALVVTTSEALSVAMVRGAVVFAQEHASRVAIVSTRLRPNQMHKEPAALKQAFKLPAFGVRTDVSTLNRVHTSQLPLTSEPASTALEDIKELVQWI